MDLQRTTISHYKSSVVWMPRALLCGIYICVLVCGNIIRIKIKVNRENHTATLLQMLILSLGNGISVV